MAQLRESQRSSSPWTALAHELGPGFASRAAKHDDDESFVRENFDELKARGVFAALVPTELGGGGASHREICEMLRAMAPYCGSTALALAMHSHVVAVAVWRWRRDPASVEKLLRRVAAERLVLISSGGSDWLPGSGRAERVDGGYRITARKVYASGCPAGDLLVTCAIDEHANGGPEVLHFGLSLKAEGVRIVETWRAHGMRGTGSHDVEIEGAFVPDAAISARRVPGRWGPLFHTIYLLAFPIVYSVYVGVAEAARDIAVRHVKSRARDPLAVLSVGELETELMVAQLALEKMIELAATAEPGPDVTNACVRCRSIAGKAAIQSVDKAVECVGGQSFSRNFGLERLWRDVQAARFHALQGKPQALYSGRIALGIDVDG